MQRRCCRFRPTVSNSVKKSPGPDAGLSVVNLSGSILSWAHAGGPLVDGDGNPTINIHVFSDKWDVAPAEYEATKFKNGGGLVEMASVAFQVMRAKITSWL